jgi:hypothetical protein
LKISKALKCFRLVCVTQTAFGLQSFQLFICLGGWHACLIDAESIAYSWGWNLNGQLGLGADTDDDVYEAIASIPTPINILNENNVFVKFDKVSLGARHSALIDEDMNLYMFGWNKYKQLFVSDDRNSNVFTPMVIESYKQKVLDVKCGAWFTLILVNTQTCKN